MSVGDVPGRGNIHQVFVSSWKCSSGMCLVGEMSVGDVTGRGNVRWGCVDRGNILWRSVQTLFHFLTFLKNAFYNREAYIFKDSLR